MANNIGPILRSISAVIFILLLNVAVSGQRLVVETWDNGQEKVVFDITNGTIEEPIDYYYFKFYPNGKVYKEGNYINKQASGKWTFYYQNGKPKSIAQYAYGNLSGEYQCFYISGETELKGLYRVGQLSNVERFARDGSLIEGFEDPGSLLLDSATAWSESQKETARIDFFMPMDGVYPRAMEYCTCMIDSVAQYVEYKAFYNLSEYQRSLLFRHLMEYKDCCRGIIEAPK